MDYETKTDEELEREGLAPDGTYPFEVLEAEEQTSKAGDPMVMLKLRCFMEDGTPRTVFDYISPEWFHHKFKHFFATVGMADRYADREWVAAAFVGKAGTCKLGTEDGTAKYPAKNVINDYIEGDTPKAAAIHTAGTGGAGDGDDDLPF